MMRLAPYIALVMGGGLAVWWVMSLQADLVVSGVREATLTRSNTALITQAELSATARAVADANHEFEMQQAGEAAENVAAILAAELEECADAPLDPILRDLVNGGVVSQTAD